MHAKSRSERRSDNRKVMELNAINNALVVWNEVGGVWKLVRVVLAEGKGHVSGGFG